MNMRVDVNDLEINSRIRVGDSDVGTVKYIGEVRIIQFWVYALHPISLAWG